MFNSKNAQEARQKRDAIIEEYQGVAASAIACLEEGFEDSMTVMALPEQMRKFFRTSNHIERLNKELKRRSNVIGIFPNEGSLLRLMGAVLIERNEVFQLQQPAFNRKAYTTLISSDAPDQLVVIAKQQLQQVA